MVLSIKQKKLKNKKMLGLKNTLVAMMMVASCSVAFADPILGTVNLSTDYQVTINPGPGYDSEDIYVPAHSSITVTSYVYATDSSEYMFRLEGSLVFNNYWMDHSLPADIPETYYNDSEEGVYIRVTLDSWLYEDYNELFHTPASSVSVSYRIDAIEEEPLPEL